MRRICSELQNAASLSVAQILDIESLARSFLRKVKAGETVEIPLNEEEEARLFQSARRLRERSEQLDSFLFQSV